MTSREDYAKIKAESPNDRKMMDYGLALASPGSESGIFVAGGMLIFTEESAHKWGGPFPGGAAAYRLIDHRETTVRVPGGRDRLAAIGSRRSRSGGIVDYVTEDAPFELRLYGNDDTSYVKFYATARDAMEELTLFEACEPLDFDEVIAGFRFIFAN